MYFIKMDKQVKLIAQILYQIKNFGIKKKPFVLDQTPIDLKLVHINF